MELKKCPFCGSEVRITSRTAFEDMVRENGRSAISIECKNFDCGCEFWTFSLQHQSKDYEVAKEKAIERWNHRAEVKESESV